MKKLLLALGIMVLALGSLAAEEKPADELKLFDDFVAGLKKSAPEDAEVRSDNGRRFVYLDLRMPVDSNSPFDLDEAKAGVLLYLKGSAELFSTLKITVFVNFVTTDRRIRTVVVTPQELQAAAAQKEE